MLAGFACKASTERADNSRCLFECRESAISRLWLKFKDNDSLEDDPTALSVDCCLWRSYESGSKVLLGLSSWKWRNRVGLKRGKSRLVLTVSNFSSGKSLYTQEPVGRCGGLLDVNNFIKLLVNPLACKPLIFLSCFNDFESCSGGLNAAIELFTGVPRAVAPDLVIVPLNIPLCKPLASAFGVLLLLAGSIENSHSYSDRCWRWAEATVWLGFCTMNSG